jgi:hypothetical protein
MRAQDADVRGAGPDFSEVIVRCPRADCYWEKVFDTDETTVTIGSLLGTAEAHIAERHMREGEGK